MTSSPGQEVSSIQQSISGIEEEKNGTPSSKKSHNDDNQSILLQNCNLDPDLAPSSCQSTNNYIIMQNSVDAKTTLSSAVSLSSRHHSVTHPDGSSGSVPVVEILQTNLTADEITKKQQIGKSFVKKSSLIPAYMTLKKDGKISFHPRFQSNEVKCFKDSDSELKGVNGKREKLKEKREKVVNRKHTNGSSTQDEISVIRNMVEEVREIDQSSKPTAHNDQLIQQSGYKDQPIEQPGQYEQQPQPEQNNQSPQEPRQNDQPPQEPRQNDPAPQQHHLIKKQDRCKLNGTVKQCIDEFENFIRPLHGEDNSECGSDFIEIPPEKYCEKNNKKETEVAPSDVGKQVRRIMKPNKISATRCMQTEGKLATDLLRGGGKRRLVSDIRTNTSGCKRDNSSRIDTSRNTTGCRTFISTDTTRCRTVNNDTTECRTISSSNTTGCRTISSSSTTGCRTISSSNTTGCRTISSINITGSRTISSSSTTGCRTVSSSNTTGSSIGAMSNTTTLFSKVCYLCFRDFPLDLSEHIVQNHSYYENAPDYTCTHCGTCFLSAEEVSQHEHKVHSLTLSCPFCGLTLQTKDQLCVHVLNHLSPQIYVCMQCHEQYSSVKMVEEHIVMKHGESTVWADYLICRLCKCLFSKRDRLYSHIINLHSKLFSQKCKSCTQPFFNRNALCVHRSNENNVLDGQAIHIQDKFEIDFEKLKVKLDEKMTENVLEVNNKLVMFQKKQVYGNGLTTHLSDEENEDEIYTEKDLPHIIDVILIDDEKDTDSTKTTKSQEKSQNYKDSKHKSQSQLGMSKYIQSNKAVLKFAKNIPVKDKRKTEVGTLTRKVSDLSRSKIRKEKGISQFDATTCDSHVPVLSDINISDSAVLNDTPHPDSPVSDDKLLPDSPVSDDSPVIIDLPCPNLLVIDSPSPGSPLPDDTPCNLQSEQEVQVTDKTSQNKIQKINYAFNKASTSKENNSDFSDRPCTSLYLQRRNCSIKEILEVKRKVQQVLGFRIMTLELQRCDHLLKKYEDHAPDEPPSNLVGILQKRKRKTYQRILLQSSSSSEDEEDDRNSLCKKKPILSSNQGMKSGKRTAKIRDKKCKNDKCDSRKLSKENIEKDKGDAKRLRVENTDKEKCDPANFREGKCEKDRYTSKLREEKNRKKTCYSTEFKEERGRKHKIDSRRSQNESNIKDKSNSRSIRKESSKKDVSDLRKLGEKSNGKDKCDSRKLQHKHNGKNKYSPKSNGNYKYFSRRLRDKSNGKDKCYSRRLMNKRNGEDKFDFRRLQDKNNGEDISDSRKLQDKDKCVSRRESVENSDKDKCDSSRVTPHKRKWSSNITIVQGDDIDGLIMDCTTETDNVEESEQMVDQCEDSDNTHLSDEDMEEKVKETVHCLIQIEKTNEGEKVNVIERSQMMPNTVPTQTTKRLKLVEVYNHDLPHTEGIDSHKTQNSVQPVTFVLQPVSEQPESIGSSSTLDLTRLQESPLDACNKEERAEETATPKKDIISYDSLSASKEKEEKPLDDTDESSLLGLVSVQQRPVGDIKIIGKTITGEEIKVEKQLPPKPDLQSTTSCSHSTVFRNAESNDVLQTLKIKKDSEQILSTIKQEPIDCENKSQNLSYKDIPGPNNAKLNQPALVDICSSYPAPGHASTDSGRVNPDYNQQTRLCQTSSASSCTPLSQQNQPRNPKSQLENPNQSERETPGGKLVPRSSTIHESLIKRISQYEESQQNGEKNMHVTKASTQSSNNCASQTLPLQSQPGYNQVDQTQSSRSPPTYNRPQQSQADNLCVQKQLPQSNPSYDCLLITTLPSQFQPEHNNLSQTQPSKYQPRYMRPPQALLSKSLPGNSKQNQKQSLQSQPENISKGQMQPQAQNRLIQTQVLQYQPQTNRPNQTPSLQSQSGFNQSSQTQPFQSQPGYIMQSQILPHQSQPGHNLLIQTQLPQQTQPGNNLLIQTQLPQQTQPGNNLLIQTQLPQQMQPGNNLLIQTQLPQQTQPGNNLLIQTQLPQQSHPGNNLLIQTQLPQQTQPGNNLLIQTQLPQQSQPGNNLLIQTQLPQFQPGNNLLIPTQLPQFQLGSNLLIPTQLPPQSQPQYNKPSQAQPSQSRPGYNRPIQTMQSQTQPGNNGQSQTQSLQSQPGNNRQNQTQSSQKQLFPSQPRFNIQSQTQLQQSPPGSNSFIQTQLPQSQLDTNRLGTILLPQSQPQTNNKPPQTKPSQSEIGYNRPTQTLPSKTQPGNNGQNQTFPPQFQFDYNVLYPTQPARCHSDYSKPRHTQSQPARCHSDYSKPRHTQSQSEPVKQLEKNYIQRQGIQRMGSKLLKPIRPRVPGQPCTPVSFAVQPTYTTSQDHSPVCHTVQSTKTTSQDHSPVCHTVQSTNTTSQDHSPVCHTVQSTNTTIQDHPLNIKRTAPDTGRRVAATSTSSLSYTPEQLAMAQQLSAQVSLLLQSKDLSKKQGISQQHSPTPLTNPSARCSNLQSSTLSDQATDASSQASNTRETLEKAWNSTVAMNQKMNTPLALNKTSTSSSIQSNPPNPGRVRIDCNVNQLKAIVDEMCAEHRSSQNEKDTSTDSKDSDKMDTSILPMYYGCK